MDHPATPPPPLQGDETTYRDQIIAAIALEALDTLTLPHVVHVTDPYLDIPVVFGPFPTPLEAATFADRYRADLSDEGCDQQLTTTVVPLRPG